LWGASWSQGSTGRRHPSFTSQWGNHSFMTSVSERARRVLLTTSHDSAPMGMTPGSGHGSHQLPVQHDGDCPWWRCKRAKCCGRALMTSWWVLEVVDNRLQVPMRLMSLSRSVNTMVVFRMLKVELGRRSSRVVLRQRDKSRKSREASSGAEAGMMIQEIHWRPR
jgi:hypothetical protein